MSFATSDDCDADLQTDAVADKPRDVIKDQPSVKLNGHDNLQQVEEKEKSPPNTINCQKPKVLKSPLKPKKKQGSTPTKTQDSTNSFLSQGAGGITVNISRSSGIHVGNTVHINMGGNNDAAGTRKSRPPGSTDTKEIKRMKQNTEPVTIVGLQLISSHVGENWREVGRALGYSDGQMDQFKADNGSTGLKEVVFQLLLDWKRMNTKDATVSKITSALCEADQYDAVEAMVEVFAIKPTKT